MRRLSSLLSAAALLGAALAAQNQALPAPAKDPRAGAEFFESRVRPVLVAHCYACHSDARAKPAGGLRLDVAGAWLKGHDAGAAVVPGDTERSSLVRAVRYVDEDLQMPPAGKLDEKSIADLEAWVAMGAPGPDVGDAASRPADAAPEVPAGVAIRAAARAHRWFAPVAEAAPPTVKNAAWPKDDLDRFVLAALERENLRPAPEADRRTWLRRATFDLTGLPPTVDEVRAFEADASPDAYAKVVDRLLASSHYGERWARHWLDVARYADSNGLDENLALGNAWRYRDWVVRALNADLPYDRFATYQLAGDLVPEPPADDADRFDRTIATGFLVLGPKMLAEQDKPKLVIDSVDEQLDVASRAFMGLTVGCARCHDHKFDPVSHADYYALAGVFKSTKSFENLAFVSKWNQRDLARPEQVAARDEHRKKLTAAEAATKAARAAGRRAAVDARLDGFAAHLVAADRARAGLLVLEAEEPSRGSLIADRKTWGDADCVVARTGDSAGKQFAEYDVTVASGGPRRLLVRYASAEKRPLRVSLDGVEAVAKALDDETGGFFPVDQVWADVGLLTLKPGRNVLRLETLEGPYPHVDRLVLEEPSAAASAGLDADFVRALAVALVAGERRDDPVWRLWRNREAKTDDVPAGLRRALAAAPAPTTPDEVAARYASVFAVVADAWRAAAAKDERATPKLDEPGLDLLARALFGGAGVVGPRGRIPESSWPAAVREPLVAARTAEEALKKDAPPPFDRCLAVEEGKAEDLAVHLRGNHLNLAEKPVPRGFLSYLSDVVPWTPIPAGSSGRLEFARWLVDPRHPLTARVAVNRIWQGHFGRGLVPSSSNFGLRAEAPAAPEYADLLDALAKRFVASGWSTKALHRAILLSATYRTGAAHDAAAAERDPDARLLWRAPRRRLEAEPIRDAILAASGRLDRKIGGPSLDVGDGDYVTNDQSADAARYGSKRRALYLPVVRNALYDFFASFDFGDPSSTLERRPTTVVPAQALWLRNSPFVREEAAALAQSLAAATGGDLAAFVRGAYERVYARTPTEAETARARAYLRDDPARGADFCRALFCAEEFLYVD